MHESAAYLGPAGTHSHAAAAKLFGTDAAHAAETIEDVCAKVATKETSYGVLPVENSIGGIVQETVDALLVSTLHVVGSLTLPIHHALLGRTHNLFDIKTVSSHPQALRQCKAWLAKNLPQAKIRISTSTTQALAEEVDPAVAFIADASAAALYGLSVLAPDIEDSSYNATEFYVVATKPQPKMSEKLSAKHTVLVIRTHDRPGMLRDVLSGFADRSINLTKLHSRAIPGEKQDYYFFLEVEALPEDAEFKDALTVITPLCASVRVLGVV
jgi:chorismate mutase/prephenate dehydratase